MRCHTFPFMALLILLSACNQGLQTESDSKHEPRTIILSLCQPEGDVFTKSSYDFENKTFLWAAGDAVGIVSPQGGQLKFTIRPEDYGQVHANFDGRGFELSSGNTYAGYSPFLPDFDLEPISVPVNYADQMQTGDNSTAHLGLKSFIVAQATAPDAGSLNFQFRNVGSPHRYRLPVLPGSYSQLTIQIPASSYTLSGTLNLLANDEATLRAITPTVTTDRLTLNMSNTSIAETGLISCWMMVAPVNLVGSVITMILENSNGQEYIASLAGRDCPANNRRFFDAKSSVFPRVTEITAEGGNVQIKVIKSANDVEVTPSIGAGWITAAGSSTDGLVTTYTYTVAENEASVAREGTISFTETSTSLTNTVSIQQAKAGTIIGIGSWDNDNHSGNAQ